MYLYDHTVHGDTLMKKLDLAFYILYDDNLLSKLDLDLPTTLKSSEIHTFECKQ